MTYDNRKKLLDNLKPATKPGVGKTTPCPKCGCPDAEHYSANYIACPRCDKPGAAQAPEPAEEEKTDPGWGGFVSTAAWYRCSSCYIQTKTDPDAVADGQTCLCGGALWRLP